MRKFDPAEFFRDHPDQGIKLSPQSIRVIFNSLSGEKKQTWKTIVTVGDIWIGKDKFKKSMGLTCFFITTASAILLYYNNQHDVINHYAQVNGIKQLV